MRWKIVSSVLPILAAGLHFSSVAATPLDAASVSAFADANGAPAALARYFSCADDRQAAYDRVASGAADWIELAVRLLPSADACYAESLHDALARAIVRAPERVLSLVDTLPASSSRALCVPFLPADAPAARNASVLRHEAAVLHAVNAPALAPARDACLKAVDDALAAAGR